MPVYTGIYRYIPVHTITTFFIQVVRILDEVSASLTPPGRVGARRRRARGPSQWQAGQTARQHVADAMGTQRDAATKQQPRCNCVLSAAETICIMGAELVASHRRRRVRRRAPLESCSVW